MKKDTVKDDTKSFFSITLSDAIAVIRFIDCPISCGADLGAKESFLCQFNKIITDDRIKVIIFISQSQQESFATAINFYDEHTNSIQENFYIKRLHNAIDQYLDRITNCNKITLFVDKSKKRSHYLNIGLACDYRLATEGVLLKNPYNEHRLIPKGGVIHFLRKIIGYKRTFDFFFLNRAITQEEAIELGLLDEIAQEDCIEDIALQRASEFAVNPLHYIKGVKKLLSTYENKLTEWLDLENRIIPSCVKAFEHSGKK